jgi:hypothetical protein
MTQLNPTGKYTFVIKDNIYTGSRNKDMDVFEGILFYLSQILLTKKHYLGLKEANIKIL